MPIPKTFFQTSLHKQPEYVIQMIQEQTPNWKYLHFTDKEIIEYFIAHPLEEFPFIVNKFSQFIYGAHKADLFRYYFLYVEGGVFMDSDAMIETNIENIIQEHDFFSVKSYIDKTVFQGFIGCIPRHPIIYQALKDAYEIEIKQLLNDYHLLTANMYTFLQEGSSPYKLYQEVESDKEKAITVDDDNNILLIHYWYSKRIPQKI